MSFHFESVDRFVAGTIGLPGEREFFIQAKRAERVVTVAVEKMQVAALSDRLERLLTDLRRSDLALKVISAAVDNEALDTPIEPEFATGSMSISWDEASSTITVELYEVGSDEESSDSFLKVSLDLAQANAFVKRSKALVSSGRPPCPFCAVPVDPQGHLCPRANGYRR